MASSDESAASPRQSFPRQQRIAKRADFVRVYEKGRKQFGRFVVVFVLENGRELTRLGITATKKTGKAHLRNRMKRWVRECYRTHRAETAVSDRPLDIVVNLKPAAADATYPDFCDDLVRAIRRALKGASQAGRT